MLFSSCDFNLSNSFISSAFTSSPFLFAVSILIFNLHISKSRILLPVTESCSFIHSGVSANSSPSSIALLSIFCDVPRLLFSRWRARCVRRSSLAAPFPALSFFMSSTSAKGLSFLRLLPLLALLDFLLSRRPSIGVPTPVAKDPLELLFNLKNSGGGSSDSQKEGGSTSGDTSRPNKNFTSYLTFVGSPPFAGRNSPSSFSNSSSFFKFPVCGSSSTFGLLSPLEAFNICMSNISCGFNWPLSSVGVVRCSFWACRFAWARSLVMGFSDSCSVIPVCISDFLF